MMSPDSPVEDYQSVGGNSLRRTYSDTATAKKTSLVAKRKRKISRNARKLVENFGFKLNRENSTLNSERSKQNSIELKAEMYKKRQGFTGFQAKVKARLTNEEILKKLWPLRYVELKCGVLSYYKIQNIGSERVISDSPRGSIDLKQRGVCFKLSYPSSDSNSELHPTDLQFDIVYNNILKPTEWITYTFCCKNRDQFYTWVMAISHEIFNRNIQPETKVLMRNSTISFDPFDSLMENNERNKPRSKSNIPIIDLNSLMTDIIPLRARPSAPSLATLPSPTINDDDLESETNIATETERESEDFDTMSIASTGILPNRVRKRRFPFVRKRRVDFNENLRKLEIEDIQSSSDSLKIFKQVKVDEKPENIDKLKKKAFIEALIHIFIVQILLLFLSFRQTSFDVIFFSIIILNVLVMRSLYNILDLKDSLHQTFMSIFNENITKTEEKEDDLLKLNSISLPLSSPISKIRRTSTPKRIEVKNEIKLDIFPLKLPLEVENKFNPFKFDFLDNMKHLETNLSNGIKSTWQYTDHRFANLRIGPNYKMNKLKKPSKTSFFVPVGLDLYHSPNGKKINKVMEYFKFPHKFVNPSCKDIPQKWKGIVPDLLVINFQIFSVAGFFSSAKPEPAQSWVQFFSPADFLINSLNDESLQDNSTKLFLNWLKNAEVNTELKHKLKMFAYVRNLKESGLPNWISRLNGKPCMVTKSCSFHHGSSFDTITGREMHYLELDIDIGAWSILVKRGVKAIVPGLLKNLHWTVSFVIQGEKDEELPERTINAMEFYKVDTTKLKIWPFANDNK